MGGTTAILDACAVLTLRMSRINENVNNRSIYQILGNKESKRMHRLGVALNEWLNKILDKGVELCITNLAWFMAKERYDAEIRRLAYEYQEFRRAIWILENDSYRQNLWDLTRSCHRVSPKRFRRIKKNVKKFYDKWYKDGQITECISKRGGNEKDTYPENEDIIRLSEAISNKESSGYETYFVTGDSHFICYRTQIKNEFDILLTNYFSLLKK